MSAAAIEAVREALIAREGSAHASPVANTFRATTSDALSLPKLVCQPMDTAEVRTIAPASPLSHSRAVQAARIRATMHYVERLVRRRLRTGARMNRIVTTVTFLAALGALTSGCGDPDGISAQGSVSLTVHQSGQADGTAGFSLPSGTFIDPPPGVGRGFFGTCVRNGSRWTIDISRADSVAGGLRRVVLSGSENAAANSASATFTLGTTQFAASSGCTGTAASFGDRGVRFTATCTGVAASGDLRTVDASVNLTLEQCTIQ